jgi:hypothetical protein
MMAGTELQIRNGDADSVESEVQAELQITNGSADGVEFRYEPQRRIQSYR